MTAPPQGRTRRPFFFDARFVIGLVLVVASVAGVYAIVASADRSTEVYAARGALVAGESLHADDLVVTTVRLGAADRLYLARGALPDHGAVVTRSVAAGELVPASAVSDSETGSQTSVVLQAHGDLPASVTPGSAVDIWAAALEEHNRYAAPVVLVDGATVVRVIQGDGLVGQRDGRSVEVRVPGNRVAAVLESIANDDAISLVPAIAASGDDRG
jgi:hypothetical protein